MRSHTLKLRTSAPREIQIITSQVETALKELGATEGLCTIFTPHTTAAITINENADPDVLSDLTRAFEAMIPNVEFDHAEGNSDAHLLSAIIGASVCLPVVDGKLVLGRWQGIYFVELDGPRTRQVAVWI